jgi:hypothetical protein
VRSDPPRSNETIAPSGRVARNPGTMTTPWFATVVRSVRIPMGAGQGSGVGVNCRPVSCTFRPTQDTPTACKCKLRRATERTSPVDHSRSSVRTIFRARRSSVSVSPFCAETTRRSLPRAPFRGGPSETVRLDGTLSLPSGPTLPLSRPRYSVHGNPARSHSPFSKPHPFPRHTAQRSRPQPTSSRLGMRFFRPTECRSAEDLISPVLGRKKHRGIAAWLLWLPRACPLSHSG